VKDYQIDPTKRELLHADFFEVSLTEKVKVSINIIPVGEPVGVKRDGGIIQHVLREIEIECLPDKIPANVEIDITELEIGQSFHVSDLKLEEGVEILTDPEEVILTIVAPVIEEVAPVEEAPAEEAEEPEVVKKGKKEEEGEETAAEPEKAQEKEEGSKG
jgi:large subunit ribosomal protein L25